MAKLFLLACVCAAAAAGDCNNAVFKDINSWGGKTSQFPKGLVLSPEPIDYPSGAQQCAYFKNDKQCCTAETLDDIEAFYKDAEAVVDKARDEINSNPWVNRTVGVINGAVALVCNHSLSICPHDFTSIMNKYVQEIADNAVAIQTAQVDCVSTQLAYIEGMTCFACDADWEKYINETGKVVHLADSVCTGVVKGCQPIYNSVNTMLRTMSQFISEVLTWSTLIHFNISLDNVPDMCGGTFKQPGDCSDFFCHDMLNGFGVPHYGWDPSKGMGTLASTATPQEARQFLTNTMTTLHRRLFSEIAASPTKEAAVSSHNDYTSSGYDALAVGCVDNPNSPACSGAGLPAYAIALIVISVVGGLAGVLIYFQRRKQARGDTYNAIP